MAVIPSFLIVGAMKSGTTTLYHDLQSHPDIFLPDLKEPDTLVRLDDVAAIRADYASLFHMARAHQLTGEASTAYTKRPEHEGVAAKALAACGPDLRIIYMRRDPVQRTVSQYHHERQLGQVAGDIDHAIRTTPRLIDYSRYDWQIAPWIATFGADHVLQLELEQFSADRRKAVEEVVRFIGADPCTLPPFDTERVSNSKAEQKFIGHPVLRAFIYSELYQRVVKPRLPRRLREGARRAILPLPQDAPEMSDDTQRYVHAQLQHGHGVTR